MKDPHPGISVQDVIKELIVEHNTLIARIEYLESLWEAEAEAEEVSPDVTYAVELRDQPPISEPFSPLAAWDDAVERYSHYIEANDVYNLKGYL